MTTIAIIPARRGSKGLPNKNILKLSGIPLIAHTIIAAKKSDCFKRIIVSSDCDEICNIAEKYGALSVKRPSEISGDNALTVDAVIHACNFFKCKSNDIVVLLQPTSPMRTCDDIKQSITLFNSKKKIASVISVNEARHHPYKSLIVNDKYLEPLRNITDLSSPRQILPRVYNQNGAIYISKYNELLEKKQFYIKPSFPYVMKPINSIDIDTESDFDFCQYIFNKRQDNAT